MRITIVEYSPEWPRLFEIEKVRLAQHLPVTAVIDHIGSTSVPGLAAKPIIDIMIGLQDFSQADALVPQLQALAYEYVPEYETELPFRRYFRKWTAGVVTYQVHMVPLDHDFRRRDLAFRDWLRNHPDVAAQYAQLKKTLAQREWRDGNEYCDAKTDFIVRVKEQALTEGIPNGGSRGDH